MRPVPPPPPGLGAGAKKSHTRQYRDANTERVLTVCGPTVKAEAEHTTHQGVANAGFDACPFLAGMREQFKTDDPGIPLRGALFDAYLALCAEHVGVPRNWVHYTSGKYGYFRKGGGATDWYDTVHNGGRKPLRGTKDTAREKLDDTHDIFFGVKVL